MKFGLTQQFDCSYLTDQKEQLLVFVDDKQTSEHHYEQLISSGFRRSGEQIYRPHCPHCHACQSIRIPVAKFTPSKSQARVSKRNRDMQILINDQDSAEYYPLYERYINLRHSEGSMYPASYQQYLNFVRCAWTKPLFLEFRLNDELVGVAVTDQLKHAFSALYTFFKPELSHRSIGTFAILSQIEQAKRQAKQYLYLGYQVDACAKMNYKSKFFPHERFFANKWHQFLKKDR